jgi:DNA protecting protein DprA
MIIDNQDVVRRASAVHSALVRSMRRPDSAEIVSGAVRRLVEDGSLENRQALWDATVAQLRARNVHPPEGFLAAGREADKRAAASLDRIRELAGCGAGFGDPARGWLLLVGFGEQPSSLGSLVQDAANVAAKSRPPAVLYGFGNPSVLLKKTSVAVVGTRQPTGEGGLHALAVGRLAAKKGLNVVSGLAFGVDFAAHLGALDRKNGSTVVVLGSEPSEIAPQGHSWLIRGLNDRVAVVSEWPFGHEVGSKNLRWTLPQRNRIQSALSALVVVVETGEEGGTMHTVGHAIAQRRKIAVPDWAYFSKSKHVDPWRWESRSGIKLVKARGGDLVEVYKSLGELEELFSSLGEETKPDQSGLREKPTEPSAGRQASLSLSED